MWSSLASDLASGPEIPLCETLSRFQRRRPRACGPDAKLAGFDALGVKPAGRSCSYDMRRRHARPGRDSGPLSCTGSREAVRGRQRRIRGLSNLTITDDPVLDRLLRASARKAISKRSARGSTPGIRRVLDGRRGLFIAVHSGGICHHASPRPRSRRPNPCCGTTTRLNDRSDHGFSKASAPARVQSDGPVLNGDAAVATGRKMAVWADSFCPAAECCLELPALTLAESYRRVRVFYDRWPGVRPLRLVDSASAPGLPNSWGGTCRCFEDRGLD